MTTSQTAEEDAIKKLAKIQTDISEWENVMKKLIEGDCVDINFSLSVNIPKKEKDPTSDEDFRSFGVRSPFNAHYILAKGGWTDESTDSEEVSGVNAFSAIEEKFAIQLARYAIERLSAEKYKIIGRLKNVQYIAREQH